MCAIIASVLFVVLSLVHWLSSSGDTVEADWAQSQTAALQLMEDHPVLTILVAASSISATLSICVFAGYKVRSSCLATTRGATV